MVPLMSRIAWLICDKVARHVNPQTILADPSAFPRTIIMCKEAQEFLLAWEETYLDVRFCGIQAKRNQLNEPPSSLLSPTQVRGKIESQGRDARWEFDRAHLFFKTKYMAGICKVSKSP